VKAVKFLWKRKHFEEAEAFDFLKSGSRSIFHKTWSRDVEAAARSGSSGSG